jgi:polysaccharide export outer membrane protein
MLRRSLPAVTAMATLALAVSGCAIGQKRAERKVPQYGTVAADVPRELQMVSLPPHVVEPPDEIEISVLPTALRFESRTVRVQADGVVDLGQYGDLYVSGLTLADIERKLEFQLAPIADAARIKGPLQISVRLVDGTLSKRYYVLGVVNTQGSFPITGSETVLDGILAAGLRTNSLPEKAYLARPHPAGGPDQVFSIDWCGITKRGDTLTNYQLLPGDRIHVPGTKEPSLIQSLIQGN